MKQIDIKILDPRLNEDQYKLGYATAGSAGIDLRACLHPEQESIILYPGEQSLVMSGIAIHLNDQGYAAMILPRSGNGVKGLVLANTVGLIDSDYSSEIKVCLWNRHPNNRIEIMPMMRVAQLVIVNVNQVQFNVVDDFNVENIRGGFGSTGLG